MRGFPSPSLYPARKREKEYEKGNGVVVCDRKRGLERRKGARGHLRLTVYTGGDPSCHISKWGVLRGAVNTLIVIRCISAYERMELSPKTYSNIP